MKEANEIIKTLKQSDNMATESPYWLILDPRQNMRCSIDNLASQITGPFFSGEDAHAHLEARKHAFSERAKAYCMSGYWSSKYNALCRAIKPGCEYKE
jgi:hypothetical protein